MNRPENVNWGKIHRDEFKELTQTDLTHYPLWQLSMLQSRLLLTLEDLHKQVHQCRRKLGLPARNYPVKLYQQPIPNQKTLAKLKKRRRKRRREMPNYVLSSDPAVQKERIKSVIRNYERFLSRVEKIIQTKQEEKRITPSSLNSLNAL